MAEDLPGDEVAVYPLYLGNGATAAVFCRVIKDKEACTYGGDTQVWKHGVA